MDTGIPNILAHLFGINPNAPDRSRLPQASVEPNGSGGRDLVFRFFRPSGVSGVNWSILETETLQNWTAVPAARRTTTNMGNGRVRHEARRTITPAAPKAFMQLQATPAP